MINIDITLRISGDFHPNTPVLKGGRFLTMNSHLLKQHTEYTKNHIKDTFINLYEKNGLEKLTVSEICKSCNISRPVFYNYFNDKYDLLEDIESELLDNIQQLNAKMPETPFSNNETTIPKWRETARYISDHRNYIRPLICTPGDPLFVHKWNKLIRTDMLKRLQFEKLPAARQNIIAYAMASATIGLYEYWLQYEPDLSSDKIAEIGSQLLWSSIYKFKKTVD